MLHTIVERTCFCSSRAFGNELLFTLARPCYKLELHSFGLFTVRVVNFQRNSSAPCGLHRTKLMDWEATGERWMCTGEDVKLTHYCEPAKIDINNLLLHADSAFHHQRTPQSIDGFNFFHVACFRVVGRSINRDFLFQQLGHIERAPKV